MQSVKPALLSLLLLSVLPACLDTEELKLGALPSARDGATDLVSFDAGSQEATPDASPTPMRRGDGGGPEQDARDAGAGSDAAAAANDANVEAVADANPTIDASATTDDAEVSSDGGSGAATDARTAANDAAQRSDGGDGGRTSLLCMLEPWHCL
jgi:hypothetical protein